MAPSRLALSCAVAVIVAASAVGLLWRPAGVNMAGRLSAAAATAEYHSEARSLEARGLVLAPGWRWPAGAVLSATGPDGTPMYYNLGDGVSQADRYWFYSWASRATSPHQLLSIRQTALKQLLRIRETAYYKQLIPDTRAYLDEELRMALADNFSRLREDVKVNRPSQ